uniref:Uncharacterized protein n=1 Tax=Physcomitrium patens TaxID=3218 RepID=A0A2K1LBM1_PHYPA|nr:hypothetical protein PHYPA_001854 [Physcomitrium patens]
MGKVKSALRELEDIGNRCKHIENQGIEQLANSITPRLRNLLNHLPTLRFPADASFFNAFLRLVDMSIVSLFALLRTD